VHRPRFYSKSTASFNAYSIIFRASLQNDVNKTNIFLHLGSNLTGGLCSLSQIRETLYYCNKSLMNNISLASDPSFDFALIFDGDRVLTVFFNGVTESSGLSIPVIHATAAGLYLGRSSDGSVDSSLDGSLVYLMILNRAVSGSEVEKLIQWSDNVHTVGASSRHFAFGVWNSFSFTTSNQNQYNIIWRIPSSARPALARTLSFLLLLPTGISSSRNLLLFSAPGAFYSRRFGIDWIQNNTESSQLYIYDAKDSTNVNGSKCGIPGSGSMKIDVIVSLTSSGDGSSCFVYVNQVLRPECGFSMTWSSAFYAGDILTRQSNDTEVGEDVQFQHVRVLPYAASHFEVIRPHLFSVVISNFSSQLSSATISGCCFTSGIPCSLLAGGITVSVTCTIRSTVQAYVEFLPNVQVTSAALMHDHRVFVMEEVQVSDAT
jgi:hypothetical protein